MNAPSMRATMAAARKNLKPPTRSMDPAVRKLGELLQPQAGFVQALADKAGVPIQCLRRYRRGERDPSVSTLRAMLNVLGYDLRVVKRSER